MNKDGMKKGFLKLNFPFSDKILFEALSLEKKSTKEVCPIFPRNGSGESSTTLCFREIIKVSN